MTAFITLRFVTLIVWKIRHFLVAIVINFQMLTSDKDGGMLS